MLDPISRKDNAHAEHMVCAVVLSAMIGHGS